MTNPSLLKWCLIQWNIETGLLSETDRLILDELLRQAYYEQIELKYGQKEDSLTQHFALYKLSDLGNSNSIDLIVDTLSKLIDGSTCIVPRLVVQLLIEFQSQKALISDENFENLLLSA